MRKSLQILIESKAGLAAQTQVVFGGNQLYDNSSVARQFRIAGQVFFDSGRLPCLEAKFQVDMHEFDKHPGAYRIVDWQVEGRL